MITSRSAFPHPRLWFETTAKRARICPHGSPMPPFVTPATRRDWLWLPKPPASATSPLGGPWSASSCSAASIRRRIRNCRGLTPRAPCTIVSSMPWAENCLVRSGQGRDHRHAGPGRRGITLVSTTQKFGRRKPLRASRSGRGGSGRVGATLAALPGSLSCAEWPDWPRQEAQILDFSMIGPMT